MQPLAPGLAGHLPAPWVLLALAAAFACNRQQAAARAQPAPAAAKLDARHACLAPERPSAAIRLAPVFDSLETKAPVALVQAPRLAGEPSGRWFVVDQRGYVRSFYATDRGRVSEVRESDLTDRVVIRQRRLDERGLLGIALHPRYPHDSRAFVTYTADSAGLVLRVSSFVTHGGVLDTGSEVILLEAPQPYSNHNGGDLSFGPDGFLYIGVGDGGAANDPHGNGQNTDTLLGSILRIDVDQRQNGLAYAIPADNPFRKGGGRPEIYAYGLRNPWRFSFDRESGALLAGDVGQEDFEEINRIELGGNYGWNLLEGFECFPSGTEACEKPATVRPPLFTYPHTHSEQRSVTGGFVYRGAKLPELVGQYVFADFETGAIWRLEPTGRDAKSAATRLIAGGFRASGFAEDRAGELYVLDYARERILKIERGRGHKRTLPELLSQTGCVDPNAPERLVAGAIPYDVALPFWSDGADKQRFLFMPPGEKLVLHEDGDFEIPHGSVLIKNFSRSGQLFETRFYVRHADGEYSGYSYAWFEDGKDARLVQETEVREVQGSTWVFPGMDACNQCHTAAAGRTLGLELAQLDLPEAGGSQLARFKKAGILSDALPSSSRAFSTAASWPVAERARAYLHVNCSSCHRPRGSARGGLDLRFNTRWSDTGLCDDAQLGSVDAPGQHAKVLAPGKPQDSVLLSRMARRGAHQMPPLASLVVDERGVALVRQFIETFSGCH